MSLDKVIEKFEVIADKLLQQQPDGCYLVAFHEDNIQELEDFTPQKVRVKGTKYFFHVRSGERDELEELAKAFADEPDSEKYHTVVVQKGSETSSPQRPKEQSTMELGEDEVTKELLSTEHGIDGIFIMYEKRVIKEYVKKEDDSPDFIILACNKEDPMKPHPQAKSSNQIGEVVFNLFDAQRPNPINPSDGDLNKLARTLKEQGYVVRKYALRGEGEYKRIP